MLNKYIKNSRLSERQTREILKYFSLDVEATKIALLTHISRQSINRTLMAIRKRVALFCEAESIFQKGIVRVDEICFGIPEVRAKGGVEKNDVFGLVKRGEKVYAQALANCSANDINSFLAFLRNPEPSLFPDGFIPYDGLVDYSRKKLYRVRRRRTQLTDARNRIDAVENFWGYVKMRLSRFRGVSKQTFYLHLKECEFRFNHRRDDLYKMLLKEFRKAPLELS